MSVRYWIGLSDDSEEFVNGKFTREIARVLDYFERVHMYRPAQYEALETTLLYLWSEFNRIEDVTIFLNEKNIRIYTSHDLDNAKPSAANGWFELRINLRGEVHFVIGYNIRGGSWGTSMFTPVRELKWDRFVHEMKSAVRPSALGLRV